MHLPRVHGENELVELRRIFDDPGSIWFSGLTPGGLEGVTGPRVCRDAYEQSAQHRKHTEEILQFMSQWKLAAINTYPLEEEADTQVWTWTLLKRAGTGSREDANWTTVWLHQHCKQQHGCIREG